MADTGAAAALTDVVDEVALDDRRRAARALLRRPLMTAADPAFPLVRRHAEQLRTWFAEEAGWFLTVDTEVARLRKIPADPADATRPALAPGSGQPFSRRRYVLLCLALATLGRAEAQTTLGALADGILAAAADPALTAAGVRFRLEGRDERSDLVAVVRVLLDHGVLSRVSGDEEAYLRDTGDVLYDVHRRVLAAMAAGTRGPSTIDVAPADAPQVAVADRASETTFAARLAALVDEPVPDAAEARTRRARQDLTRRLLDDPVVYTDDVDEHGQAYMTRQRTVLARRLADATGLVPEVRAEGVALLDPDGDATDLGMPEQGTEGHAALVVAEALAAADAPVPLDEVEAVVARAAQVYPWRKDAKEPGAARGLAAIAVDRLCGLRLADRRGGLVQPLPALARFAVEEPELLGRAQHPEPESQ